MRLEVARLVNVRLLVGYWKSVYDDEVNELLAFNGSRGCVGNFS